MRELEPRIAAWRETMAAALPTETVRELEEHLRDQIEALMQRGATPEQAFAEAAERLGEGRALAREFQRVGSRWFGGVYSREARIMATLAGVLGAVTWVAYVPWLYKLYGIIVRDQVYLNVATLLYLALLVAFVVLGAAALPMSIRFLRAPTARDGRILVAYTLLILWKLCGYAMAWMGVAYWPKVAVVLATLAALALLWRTWSNHLKQTQNPEEPT